MPKPNCDFAARCAASVPSLDNLSPLTAWRLRRHTAGCAVCAQSVRQLQNMENAARALYANAAPPALLIHRAGAQIALLPPTTNTRRPSRFGGKMQRTVSFAALFCAACAFMSWYTRRAPVIMDAPPAVIAAPTASQESDVPPIPSDLSSEHVALYLSEEGDDHTGKTVHFGGLVKMEEWWKQGGVMRQETPLFSETVGLTTQGRVPPVVSAAHHWRTIYKNQTQWQYSAETGNVGKHLNQPLPSRTMIVAGYHLNNLAGDDNQSLQGRPVSDGGTKTVKGRKIHTLNVLVEAAEETKPESGMFYMCQLDAKTNLPVQVDCRKRRSGKWVTTARYVFAFNQSLPDTLFDPAHLGDAPPEAFTFAATAPQ